MFKLQTLSIPSNQLAAVNRRIPIRLAAVRCRSATVEDFAAHAVSSRNPASASLYEVLKVKRNASPTDIKRAYRRLAKLYHPDANSTASKEKDPVDCRHFIEIHNAYETLSDPKARSVYDCSIGMGGRRMAVARSATSTTSFSGHSSSPRSTTSFSGHSSSPRSTASFSGCTSSSSSPRFSPRSSVRAGRGFYPSRRWESDQCW